MGGGENAGPAAAGKLWTLPVMGATGVETADLDVDGWLDIVAVGFWDPAYPDHGGNVAPPCHIWWGSPKGYSCTRYSQLTIEGSAQAPGQGTRLCREEFRMLSPTNVSANS